MIADFALGATGGLGCMYVGWLIAHADVVRLHGEVTRLEGWRDYLEGELTACRSKLAALRAVLGPEASEVPE